MEERIVTKTQKGEDVQVQNQGDADWFFDVHGIVRAEFSPQGQTINQHVYINILRRLMRSVREKRRELWETRSSLLHRDNQGWQYGTFRICLLRTSLLQPYRTSVPYFSSIFEAYRTNVPYWYQRTVLVP